MNHSHIATISALLLTFVPAAIAQDEAPTRYNVAAVPDQTVWSSTTRSFHLHWDEQLGTTFTYTASPQPTGTISLTPILGSDWQFSFTPSETDENPITITLRASRAGQSTSHEFVLDPQQALAPEEAFFASGEHTQAPVSRADVSVFVKTDPVARQLNYVNRNSRTVRIIGETVELEDGHANGLAEFFGPNDIRSIEIIAERVIVRDVMIAKQTDLTIYARELAFEDDGKFVTTPQIKTTSPGTSGNGSNGLDAGDITLHVGEIITDAPGARFDLTGGRGQVGGPGSHGTAGSDVTSLGTTKRVCDSGACKTHTVKSGYSLIYWEYRLAGIYVTGGGKENGWPGDGTDAKASGKPGEGGDAGSLTSSTPLVSSLYTLPGGATPGPTRPTSFPTTYYKGGRGGYPTNSEKADFWYVPFSMKSESAGRRTSQKGDDAAMPSGNTTAGSEGTYTFQGNFYSWVHPLSLAKILQGVRDDYLGDRTVLAQTRLEDIIPLVQQYLRTPEFDTLPVADQLDITQQFDEMRLLEQQLEAGLDYYGNPPAWVPMLSFEVNQTLFQNELDRAMDTLYLAYWIGNKAATEQERLDGMIELRDTLRTELEEARENYNAAVTSLPVLRQKAEQLDTDIRTTQNLLEVEELDLLNSTREEDWVLGLRIGLKLSATICQMVPVYQPALGVVGEGLRAGSNFNPDRPWDSVKDVKGVAAAYSEADFETEVAAQQTAAAEIDAAMAEEDSFDYAGALQQAGTGLAAGAADFSSFVQEREVPSEEMLAELERLKSLSPEYTALLERVEDLTTRNGELAIEIVETMQKIVGLSGTMRRSVLAIGALSKDIATNATVLDPRATAYLEDMERRAFDRLAKYHYYLAKAFEYRLLIPYSEPLDLEALFDKFAEIADLNTDQSITPAQFDSFKAIYQDKLSEVAESIFTFYNSNRPNLSVPVRFNLFPEEIAALNAGEKVKLNLRDDGLFRADEENIRIVDLEIAAIEAAPRSGGLGRTASVDIKIEHSGISRIRKDGETYLFNHYNRDTVNPIVWGGRYDVIDDIIDPIKPSEANGSLLRSLLSPSAASDMLLYSRPSGWADLEISRTYNNGGGAPIDISSLRLNLIYDFTPRAQSAELRDLEVFIRTLSENGTAEESNFQPLFDLGSEDKNGRSDARGKFIRVFDSSTGPVRISAPASYGSYNFAGWTDAFGQELPGGPYPDPTFVAPLPEDTVLVAQYSQSAALFAPETLHLDAPTLIGTQLQFTWTAEPGVRLQQSSNLNSWTDVPNTEGQSSATLPKPDGGIFLSPN